MFAAKDAVGGWNVRVVAAHRSANVAAMRGEVVGRIEADPAQVRHQRFDPCMGRVGRGAVVVLAAAIEIAGNIACRNAHVAQQSDHGMRKILANASAAHNRFVDGRVDARGARHVIEKLKEPLVELVHQHKWIVAALHIHLLGQLLHRRRLDGEGAGQQHLPVVAGFNQFVEHSPCVGSEERRHFRDWLLLHD